MMTNHDWRIPRLSADPLLKFSLAQLLLRLLKLLQLCSLGLCFLSLGVTSAEETFVLNWNRFQYIQLTWLHLLHLETVPRPPLAPCWRCCFWRRAPPATASPSSPFALAASQTEICCQWEPQVPGYWILHFLNQSINRRRQILTSTGSSGFLTLSHSSCLCFFFSST